MPIHFDGHKPATLEEAVEAIWSGLDEEEVDYLRRRGVPSLHFSVGTGIRNAWNLWEKDSPLARHFAERYGLGHADDMSGMVLRALICRARDEAFDEKQALQRYLDHWAEAGVDPLTQEPRAVCSSERKSLTLIRPSGPRTPSYSEAPVCGARRSDVS